MSTPKTMLMVYGRALWRRRWYAALAAWFCCLAGWGYVAFIPNVFEGKARIYVDTESMLRPLMRGIAVDSNLLDTVDFMQRTLLSRPNLQKVVRMADLDQGAGRGAEPDQLINDLNHRISVNSEGRNLFTIAYRGPARDTATKVVQSLLTVFVESNLGNSRQDMQSARTFIDQQLSLYAAQLDQAEKKLADFKAQNIGFLPGDNNYVAKLDVAKADLAKTQAELEDGETKRDELKKQLAAVPKVIDTVSSGGGDFGPGPPLGGASDNGADAQQKVAELQQKIKDALTTLTPKHPDVVRLQKQLDQAKEEAKKAEDTDTQSAKPAVDTAVHSTVPNQVYEQLSLQLIALEGEIASLKSRANRGKAEVERWQSLAASVPEIAAQMAKLNRDYDVIKKSYDELLNRREAAKIGNDLATQTQTVQFRIVDPPDTPPNPVAPNRILLLSAVLLGSLGAGVATAFALARIDDAVSTVGQLRDMFNLPVLGAISAVAMPEKRRWVRVQAAGFAVACMSLFVTYAAILSVMIMKEPRL